MSNQTPNLDLTDSPYAGQRVLVTGATSGLGFEAAAQLAELGYAAITVTGRSADKADAARLALVERTGRDIFDTLVVDVASVASSRAAAAELAGRGQSFDALLLNAGMVPNDLELTPEGIEVCFGSSLIGHHILTTELIAADRLADTARVVIVGSEAANGDLPKALGMKIADFATVDAVAEPGFTEALTAFSTGELGEFDGNTQYATTKVVSSWWAAEMQRRHDGRFAFFTVSPGANVGTNAARHTTGVFKIMLSVMARFGHLVGMNMPVPKGARRYVDVIVGGSDFEPGRTYTSKPKKMVGELVVRDEAHLLDPHRQQLAIAALDTIVADVDASVG
ncbi:MAG: SDR family NAD(P)-dependent oxidoreductase [Actinomycetota bacterium]